MAALDVIVNEMGWSRAYAHAVLAAWKRHGRSATPTAARS